MLYEVITQLPVWLESVPSIEVIGVEVAQLTAFAPGLSTVVASAVDTVCERVLERASHA